MKDGKLQVEDGQMSVIHAMHTAVGGRGGLRAIDVKYERKKKEIKVNNIKLTIMN